MKTCENDLHQYELGKGCPECKKEYNKIWRKNNPELVKMYGRKYYKMGLKKQDKEYQLKYGRKNRKRITARQQERIEKNPNLRLKKNLRNRLLRALKGNYKNGSAVDDLGCSVDFLRDYLESKFEVGMTWSNYGKGTDKWNIDHILPLSKYDLTKRENIVKLCHYSNLQPLWHIPNIKKGNR